MWRVLFSFFRLRTQRSKKENHVKGLRTVNCVYLHVFSIQIAAREQEQVQEQKALYHSITLIRRKSLEL